MTEPREPQNILPPVPSSLLRMQETYGFTPTPVTPRPERCRAIIYNQNGDEVMVIKRIRPDRDPYAVFPGGGLEETDNRAIDGIWRELDEELGLTAEDILLTGSVVEMENEFFYLGYTQRSIPKLSIGGPEAKRDPKKSGSYEPVWQSVGSLVASNVFPLEISEQIEETAQL